MQKSDATNALLEKRKAQPPVDWPEDVEGQITELCHDLSIQVKRMRQLQERADELHTMIRRLGRHQWADLANGSAGSGRRR